MFSADFIVLNNIYGIVMIHVLPAMHFLHGSENEIIIIISPNKTDVNLECV